MPWSLTTEYALRAAASLAAAGGSPRTTAQIAADTQIPPDYLAKVLRTLARASIVRSQRGKHGGFALARLPGEFTALDVVNAVDPIRRIRECPLGLARHAHGLCPLHHRMDGALAALEQAYAGVRLSDLVEQAEGSPLCRVLPPPTRMARPSKRR